MKVSEHGLMFQGGIVIGIGGVLMLALSRKTNESIMLGDDIEVTILEVKGEQVKVGIKAPKEVPIFRKEIYGQKESNPKEK